MRTHKINLLIAMIIVAVLSACGQSELLTFPTASTVPTIQSAQQRSVPTETTSPEDIPLLLTATVLAGTPTLNDVQVQTQRVLDEHWYEYYKGTLEAGGGPPTATTSYEFQTIMAYVNQGKYPPTETPFTTPILGRHGDCIAPSKRFTYSDCWATRLNNTEYNLTILASTTAPQQNILIVYTVDTQGHASPSIRYSAPQLSNPLRVQRVEGNLVYLATDSDMNTTAFTFNLDTRQWVTANGTPIPTTPTATATPTGQYIQSLTLINADTDQPIAGYDPLQNGATLNFATLGTQNLNIRANTVPATVGSVKFVLDGSPFRIEGGAPYALNGNNGSDYYAWTPSLGSHTLQVIPYSAGNATGTQGTGMTVNFTVTNGTAATATNTTVPPTATRTNTPVPATNTPSGTSKTALFVVSNASSLNAGDTAVKTRLEGVGYTVTLKTASVSATSDATGKTLVLISSSVASTDVNTKFKSVTVPVIVWEYALYDDMAMTNTTSGTEYGYNTGTSMVITNASHPLAAGLSGTVNLYSGSTNIPFGVTTANAISVGAVSSTSTRKLEFAYDKNAAMIGGFTVNARRVGLFVVDTATPTTDAWTLFDAAVTWATAP